jgi:hypothetical protein
MMTKNKPKEPRSYKEILESRHKKWIKPVDEEIRLLKNNETH